MERIRANFPNAYRLWSPEEEILLKDAFYDGKPIDEISRLLQRQPGGIRSRIRKLGLAAKKYKQTVQDGIQESEADGVLNLSLRFLPEEEIGISIRLFWQPVLHDGSAPYLFPQPATPFMRDHYKGPAIYRWKIIDPTQDHLLALYIGSTKAFCPDRLNGYLHPKESKTNQRLNREFQGYLQQGCTVALDVLGTYNNKDLASFSPRTDQEGSRVFLECLLIHYYRCKGQHLLNL
jgi:hypothetical protein